MLMYHMKRALEAHCTYPRKKLKYKDQTRIPFYGGMLDGERRVQGEMQKYQSKYLTPPTKEILNKAEKPA